MGMFDGVMKMSFLHKLNISPIFLAYGESNKNKKKTNYRERSRSSMAAVHAVPIKISSSITGLTRSQSPNSKVKESNLVGVIGGASSCSTLIFLAKLVFWSSRNDEECVPFIVSSDPSINKEGPKAVIENLRVKRVYLERGGAKFIVMPCHVFQLWHREISEGCSVPFFDLCDCVVNELGNARLKPLEIGRKVRIGVIAKDSALIGGYYLEKLQNQGFEVVLLDKETTEHIITPAIEALKRKDMEGARNLLRIAIHLLLVRAVNRVILASDEFQGLLPHDDPLLKKCINPMDALARSTIKWTRSVEKVIDSYGECLEDQIRSINHMRMSMSNELLHETRFALSCIWNVIREDNNVLLKELYYTISTAFSKENRYVVFPMNTNGRHASPNHWTVMVLDIHDKKWTFYNSIHPRKNTTDHYYNDALTVKRFVERHINMEIHPDWGDARIEQCLDSPQQREAIDCGIFVMYIMKQYAANMPVAKKLSVADVRGVRRDVIHALVNHPHYSWVPVVGGDVEKIQPDQGIP